MLQTAHELYHRGSETDAQGAAASNKQVLAGMCQQAGRHRDAIALYLEVRCPIEHLQAGGGATGRRLHCMPFCWPAGAPVQSIAL